MNFLALLVMRVFVIMLRDTEPAWSFVRSPALNLQGACQKPFGYKMLGIL